MTVIRAFAVLGLAARLAGALAVVGRGVEWLVLIQIAGGLLYGLVAARSRSVGTMGFLPILGTELLAWGVAMTVAFGVGAFFQIHCIVVTAGILLLLHDVPVRVRVVLYVVPVFVPVPFLVLLHTTDPLVGLSPTTVSILSAANQLTGVAVLLAISAVAMTDHTRARRVAEERAEAQTRLIEDLSHELRTPLATVLTSAQGARASGTASGAAADSLEWIEDSARSAGRLVERMLDLASLERGWRPEARVEALPEAVHGTVGRLRPLAASRQVDLRLQVAGEPTRKVDATSLEIVLQNLVANAVAHSPPGGTVEVRLVEQGGVARIEVEDEGEGIPEADLSRIFDRMWRADRARSRDEGRYGLGLAIAREHAELIGATIAVRSEPGRGSVFTVELAGEPLSARA